MLPIPHVTSLEPKPPAVQKCALGLIQCPLRSTGQVSLILVEAEERMRAASVSQEDSAAKGQGMCPYHHPCFLAIWQWYW